MTAPRFVVRAMPAREPFGAPVPPLPPVLPAPPVLPGPQPLPEERRRHLRVLPEPPSTRARRLSRLFTGLAAIVVCFGLFGIVGLHVVLAQGQGGVERLSVELERQEQEQQRLRLEVAELNAPSRVVEAARSRLGMVAPTTVVPLAPASLADPPATTIPAPTATTVPTTAPPTSTTLP